MINIKQLLTFLVVIIISIAALYAIKIFDITYPISIVTTNRSTEFSVVGEGKIEAIPDTAYVDVGITINSPTSVEAVQNQINEINNKIIESMNTLGIAKADIKTSNYSVYPMYEKGPTAKPDSYSGNVTISIKVKTVSKVAQVIQGATKSGANTIQGVRFSIDNPDKLREQARDKAISNAKDQAQRLATSLGIKLGKITNIVESNASNSPMPMFDTMSARTMGGGGGAPQVEAGTQTISSVVTLYYEKK